jgi:GTP cyclohydrolase I
VDLYARRLQLQERLTSQTAERLVDELDPRDVVVMIEAEDLGMTMRGVQKPVSYTRTSVVRGIFREKAEARAEALELPDDPASARATRRSDERYRLRSNQPGSRQ